MVRALPYILLAVLVYLTLIFLQNYQPELLARILIKVDVFDLTPEGKQEHARLAAINHLPIHYEEKQVLINHTVFLGSTQEMVMLALGEPKKTIPASGKNEQGETVSLIYFIYYLPNDKRPTKLVFQQDKADNVYKLVDAKKGSVLEWEN